MPGETFEALVRWGIVFFWACVPIALIVAARRVLRAGAEAAFPRVLASLKQAAAVTMALSLLVGGAWWGLTARGDGLSSLPGVLLFPAFALLSVGVAASAIRAALESALRAERGAWAWAGGVIAFFLGGAALYGAMLRSRHPDSFALTVASVVALGVALTVLGLNRLGETTEEGIRRLAGREG